MTNQSIDAYAAGLIDGEGCIYLQKNRQGKSFTICVEIGMAAKALHLLRSMQVQYGGSIVLTRPATERWQAAWALTIFSTQAVKMLKALLPYLRLKEEQAQLAIRAWEIRGALESAQDGRKMWTEEAHNRVLRIKQRISELNLKGPQPLETIPQGGRLFALRAGGQWVSPQRTLFDDLQWQPFSESWPTAGLIVSGGAYAMPNIGESPNDAAESSLSQILETDVPPKYFLSPRAAAGILRRAERRGKTLPEVLALALRAVAGETTPTEPPLSPP